MRPNDEELRIGDVLVQRVHETSVETGMTPGQLFPTLHATTWATSRLALQPVYVAPGGPVLSSSCRVASQSWLFRADGQLVLVDTGIGNAKERPAVPFWNRLSTGYLDALAETGVRPEEVDIVVSTHLHPDHVGWNTRLNGNRWVPTFPNAHHLVHEAELRFWDPANGSSNALGAAAENVWEDSVAPLLDANLVTAWTDPFRLSPSLSLEQAPGHTPGGAVLRLESSGEGAFFIGDVLHSPTQVEDPDVNSCFCEEPAVAESTRRRLFDEASERNLVLLPGHFGAFRVDRRGSEYTFYELTAHSAS